jgi:hypothetical protein
MFQNAAKPVSQPHNPPRIRRSYQRSNPHDINPLLSFELILVAVYLFQSDFPHHHRAGCYESGEVCAGGLLREIELEAGRFWMSEFGDGFAENILDGDT